MAGLLGAWLLAALALDVLGRRSPRGDRWDAVVVAGCRVDDRGRAGVALRRRTEEGVRRWRTGQAPVVVLTGGVARGGVTEAAAAAQVARELGAPDEALVLEEQSTSTEGNARLGATLLGDTASRVLVVTDGYHAVRTRRVFSRYFESVDVAGVNGAAKARVTGALREVGALLVYAVRGRL